PGRRRHLGAVEAGLVEVRDVVEVHAADVVDAAALVPGVRVERPPQEQLPLLERQPLVASRQVLGVDEGVLVHLLPPSLAGSIRMVVVPVPSRQIESAEDDSQASKGASEGRTTTASSRCMAPTTLPLTV